MQLYCDLKLKSLLTRSLLICLASTWSRTPAKTVAKISGLINDVDGCALQLEHKEE
jgi:hypothetical protein